MSLELAANVDAHPYMSTGVWLSSGQYPFDSFRLLSQYRNPTRFIQRLGLGQTLYDPPGGSQWQSGRYDPELIDNTSPAIGSTGTGFFFMFPGDYDPQTNAQRMIGTDNVNAAAQWTEYNIDTPSVAIGTIWPNIFRNSVAPASGLTNADIGYWEIGAGSGDFVPFFDFGKMIMSGGRVKVQAVPAPGGFNGTALVEIDLDTGFGIPIPDLPIFYRATGPANDFEAGPLFGETVNVAFHMLQFIPDPDSRATAPKGVLFLTPDTALETIANEFRFYVKLVEWNPTGAGGNPTRVHKRQILLSRLLASASANSSDLLPDPPGNVRLGNTNPLANQYFVFDTTRNRFILMAGRSGALNVDRSMQLLQYGLGVELSTQRRPTSLGQPDTGRIVLWSTDLRGDLNEPVAGKQVDWTLQRTSTEGEGLNVSGASPGDLIAVTNQPVNLTVEYARRVLKNGSPLTEGVNYNFTTTGVQFIAPEPVSSEAYTVDYAHTDNPVAGPHGTLLTASSITGADGRAETRVRYDDNPDIVGTRDRVSATTS